MKPECGPQTLFFAIIVLEYRGVPTIICTCHISYYKTQLFPISHPTTSTPRAGAGQVGWGMQGPGVGVGHWGIRIILYMYLSLHMHRCYTSSTNETTKSECGPQTVYFGNYCNAIPWLANYEMPSGVCEDNFDGES